MPTLAGRRALVPEKPPSGRLHRSWRLWVAWCLVAAIGSACDDGGAAPEEETIPRQSFIEAYVALRTVGLRASQQLLSEEERATILSEQGVTEEDLFTFVEVHGRRVEFMSNVWNEIEERLETLRTQPDTSENRS